MTWKESTTVDPRRAERKNGRKAEIKDRNKDTWEMPSNPRSWLSVNSNKIDEHNKIDEPLLR